MLTYIVIGHPAHPREKGTAALPRQAAAPSPTDEPSHGRANELA